MAVTPSPSFLLRRRRQREAPDAAALAASAEPPPMPLGAVLVVLPGVVLDSVPVSRRLHAPSDAAAASAMTLIDANRTKFIESSLR
jgi:hypothetical protein